MVGFRSEKIMFDIIRIYESTINVSLERVAHLASRNEYTLR